MAFASVQLVCRADGLHVELDTQSRLVGHGEVSVDDLVRLGGDPLTVLPDPVRVDGGDVAGSRGGDVGSGRAPVPWA